MAGAEKRQQVANSALYLVPIVLGNLVPIITLPVFTRLISTEDYGAWALANVYAVFVGQFANFGLPLSYERNYFQHRAPHEAAGLLYSVVAFVAVTFGVFAAMTWFLAAPLTARLIGPGRPESLLFWSLILTAATSLKAFFLMYLRNSESAVLFVRYTIAERLVGAVASIVLIAVLRVGVMGLVIGQLIGTAGVLAALLIRFVPSLPPSFNRRLLTEALKLGYPLTPRTFFVVISKNFDKYLIGRLASLGGVGIYAIAQRVAYVAFTYSSALENVFGPRVYRIMFTQGEAGRASVGAYLTPFIYGSTAIAFLIALFSEEILRVLAPVSYQGAAPMVAILALYYGIQFFGKFPQLAYAKKTYLISILTLVALLVNVAMVALGVWLWGVIGAAWGTLAAGMLSTGLVLAAGQRYYRIVWERRKVMAILILFFGSVLLTIELRDLGVAYAVRLPVKVCLAGLFGWLGVRLRYLTPENYQLARDILLRRAAPVDPLEAAAGA